jgi:hypothetical protein
MLMERFFRHPLRLLAMAVMAALYTQVSTAELRLSRDAISTLPLGNPHDLRLSPDATELYVSDVGNNRVAVLDPHSLALLWSFGADHQSGTHDVDFDGKGRAHVADTHNNRVTVYQIRPRQAKLIGVIDDAIRGPEGVLAHPNGLIYVAGAWSGNAVAYRDGKKVHELRGLSSPHDLVLLDNGDMWLSDSGNSRILRVSPELVIKDELSQAAYDFDGVRYMDVMDDGTLIAADKNNHQVKFIASDGRLLLTLGDGRPGRGDASLTTPEGVEVKGDMLWISDSGNDRVIRYRIERN